MSYKKFDYRLQRKITRNKIKSAIIEKMTKTQTNIVHKVKGISLGEYFDLKLQRMRG